MLTVLDFFLTILHLVLIGFNLFGWVKPTWRKWHTWSLVLTLASWVLLGYFYGWGYCFVTDWHWKVKYQRGEFGMPASFVKYFIDRTTGMDVSSELVDILTLVSFSAVVVWTIILRVCRVRRYR